MGLFGFLGKAIGTVAKVGSGLGLLPGGNLVNAAVQGIVGGSGGAAKQPMAMLALKQALAQKQRNPLVQRAQNPPTKITLPGGVALHGRALTMGTRMLRLSPVMPGGAVATPGGMVTQSGGALPLAYSGSSSVMSPAKKRRKRRSTSTKRKSAKRRKGGRKLKFGSPAWRKKYLGHGKKRRAA